jgi:hypothetical protein
MSIVKSVAQALGPREDKNIQKAALVDLRDDGTLDFDSYRTFQFFPESISDTRSSEWQSKSVIGGSHPVYQWVYGSGRELSFDAVFTRDSKSIDTATSVANTVSSFAKNPLGSTIASVKNAYSGKKEGDYNVKIEGAVAWLRSKTYPSYSKTSSKPPPRMYLILPGTGVFSGSTQKMDCIPVVMSSCNVTYESFFRTGEPRSVTVALSFLEVIQVGSKWQYVDGIKNISPVWKDGDYAYNSGSQGNKSTGRPIQSLNAGSPVQLQAFQDYIKKVIV